MVRVFGLSGGIASGKSTVAARWRARGLPIIDADELAREVVAPGTEGLRLLVDAFGVEVLRADGSLNRRHVATIAFADPAARTTLEAITHPRISEACASEIERLRQQGEPLACYEAPLLVERGRTDEFRPLVIVSAPEHLQVERAMKRSGMTENEVLARLRAQLPLAEKVQVADYVIQNEGDRGALIEKADVVLDEIAHNHGVPPDRYGKP